MISAPPADFCSYFSCAPTFASGRGHVVGCADGRFERSGGTAGSCADHGGNARALYSP